MDLAESEKIRGGKNSISSRVADLVGRAMEHPWNSTQIAEALSSDTAVLLTRESETEAGVGDPIAGLVLGRRLDFDLTEIDLVAVDPGCRRRGIGSELLGEFLDREVAEGVVEVRLEMSEQNVPARALYESKGFVVVGRRARYYPDGADALLLTWRAQRED